MISVVLIFSPLSKICSGTGSRSFPDRKYQHRGSERQNIFLICQRSFYIFPYPRAVYFYVALAALFFYLFFTVLIVFDGSLYLMLGIRVLPFRVTLCFILIPPDIGPKIAVVMAGISQFSIPRSPYISEVQTLRWIQGIEYYG